MPKATNKQQKKTTQGERSDGRRNDLIELKETDGRKDNQPTPKNQLERGEEDVRTEDGYSGGGGGSSCLLFV